MIPKTGVAAANLKNMRQYKTSDKKPSEMFLNSLQGGGSHYMCCGYCGREHYCPDSDIITIGDEDYKSYLENALSDQIKNPDGVIIQHQKAIYMPVEVVHGPSFHTHLDRYTRFLWPTSII